jgi:HEAT repeat protein
MDQKRIRPLFLILLLALAIVVAGIVVFSGHSSKSPSPASLSENDQQAEPSGQNPSTPVAMAPAVSTVPAAQTSPGTGTAPPATPAPSPDKPTEKLSAVDALTRTLNDDHQSLKERQKAAKALAEEGSAQAFTALRQAVANSPDNLRASIAEVLGSSADAETTSLLTSLLGERSQVALGAIHGLAEQATPQSIQALSATLYNNLMPLDMRIEAALGLGSIDRPGVVDILAGAANSLNEEELVTQVLNGLGGRSIDDTKGFFQNYLQSVTVSSEMKVTAVEALNQAQGDASTFLITLSRNSDPEIRAAAAWAMSTTETQGTEGSQVVGLLQNESDPDVRRRLYQALGNQDSFNVSLVESLVEKETDPSAQVAGMDLLAKELRDNPSKDLTDYFDQHAVAELKQLALTGANSNDRMDAVIALKRAGTPDAQSALQDLAQNATDKRVLQNARSTFAKLAPNAGH